tara:strand:- start:386 stop:964 length:579 start_codon:yes stop_codon:yes gene_type:complete
VINYFVHVPKNAGCSISNALGRSVEVINHDRRKSDFRYFKDHNLSKKTFSFAFVRNPWDRVVSAYSFVKKGGVNAGDKADRDKYLAQYSSFSEFVKNFDDSILEQIHFVPQYKWICGDNGDVIVDFVGRFENLREDFNTVCGVIGVKAELPHSNKGKHKHYTKFYDAETEQVIAEKYAKDIEYFEYGFGDGA